MGEILGAGLTHFPGFKHDDSHMADVMRRILSTDRVPAELKEPHNWPELMQKEWGTDEGLAAAARHRQQVIGAFREVRAAIDDFRPDFVLIWGDDQYENFQDDGISPFCVYIHDSVDCQPFMRRGAMATDENIWGEPKEKVFTIKGHAAAAHHLTSRLIESDVDMSYAYRPRHLQGLARAFIDTLLYLDYDRKGWDYPVVPFHVNCYGSWVVRNRGGGAGQGELDPPGPSPRRCFEVGALTARIIKESPWRAVLIGSSSWSHASLTAKHHWLHPDIESDRRRLEDLRASNYTAFRDLTLATLEDAGEHELLNWACLAGAMHEVGHTTEILEYAESWIFNSSKCTAIWRP